MGKYKVVWLEVVEYKSLVEASSEEEAIAIAGDYDNYHSLAPKETGWREIEPDTIEAREIE